MSPHSQQCDPLPCLWGESCICFSNGPKCPHLTVSVPSHSAHKRTILDGVSRGTALLPLLWLLSPLLGPSSESGVSSCSCNRTVLLVSFPGYGTYLSLQFSKPSQRQSPPHLCLRIPMGILCVFTGKPYPYPTLVPAVFFFLLWFSYSPIPWLCPQILCFSQSQLKIFLRTSLSTRQQPTRRSWEPLAAKGRPWLVQLWEKRHCPSRSSPLHPWRAHRKVQATWPRDSPD